MTIVIKLTKRRLALLLSAVLCMALTYLIAVKKIYPYDDLSPIAKEIRRYTLIHLNGEKDYVKAQLDTQYADRRSNGEAMRRVETAVLPLQLRFVYIGESGTFPSAGGAIAVVEGKLVVLDRLGGIYVFRNEILHRLRFPDFPNGLHDYLINSRAAWVNSDSMRAHSIAYDKTTGRIYVSYTKFVSRTANRFAISAISIDSANLDPVSAWESVFESTDIPPEMTSQAGGGKLLIENNKVYFSTGYAEELRKEGKIVSAAQDKKSPFGKIFEIDLNTREARLKALGLRNSQGITLTTEQYLLAVDQGPQGGDEINLIEDGKNYGWPFRTYGTRYGTYDYNWPPESIPTTDEFTEPLYAFVPSIATSSIFAIKDFDERWKDNVIVGALKAQSLFRIKLNNRAVVFSEPIWIGHRIRDINQLGKELVLLTDDSYLIFVTVDEKSLKRNTRNAGYNFEPKLARCLLCHHFEQTTPSSMAPSLANILGRKIGSDNFVMYSDALRRKGGRWDRESLAKFIANPASYVPGTTMPSIGLSHDDAEEIVEILGR